MAIEHKDIPDGQRHEPKGVSSALTGQVYVANGSNSGAWRRIVETDLDHTDKTKNIFGWNDISDDTYTSGSPLAISNGVRTKLTNDGAAVQTDISRLGNIWDTVDNEFLINDPNAVYMLRLNMKIVAAASAGTPYLVLTELEYDPGSPIVIAGSTNYIKGGSVENQLSNVYMFYMGSTINNSPLTIHVTPDTNITLYDIGFVIQRLYKES